MNMDWSPIDFRRELNDEQYAAVTADAGPALVLAGAGSGKTRTLTFRVAYLLLVKRVHPDSMLLLTFTNKAAKEMTERVRALIGMGPLPRWSGTFHSIGGRMLRRYGEHVGLKPSFTILDQSDAESLLTKVIKEADKQFLKNKENPKAKVLLNLISYGRNTQKPLSELTDERFPWDAGLRQKIEGFAKLYQTAKREQQVADYDDLLTDWLTLVRDVAEVREAFQRQFGWVLVDEYQDTNTLQSEIVDRIAAHHNIMAVGDDAQCIYTWRGANYENIRGFPERHPGTQVYKILTNYRSSPEILTFANAVLKAQPMGSGYEKELLPHKPSRSRPWVVPVMSSHEQALFIATRIAALYDEGYALDQIAILYRAHYQAVDVQLELARQGVPFVITSGVRFFEQAHIKDFVAQLRVVANPEDQSGYDRLLGLLPRVGPVTIRKILLAADKVYQKRRAEAERSEGDLFGAPQLGKDVTWVDVLHEDSVAAKVPADAREDYLSLVATLQEIQEQMRKGDKDAAAPSALVAQALDGWYRDFLPNVYPDWQDRQEDLDSLVAFASRFETLSEFLAQLVLMTSETGDKGVELESGLVRMSTIHQAKGLEFPIVFVLSCAEDLFPLRRTIETGDVEEERRLFYVAVTRAMDELYLSFPLIHHTRGGSQHMEPSRFLREIPKEHYEKLHYHSLSSRSY
ncbi:MAG: ATP-dependent helicase [Opitutales bacterium]|nr:ATP-dependent helicase [Opitutales bacterium]